MKLQIFKMSYRRNVVVFNWNFVRFSRTYIKKTYMKSILSYKLSIQLFKLYNSNEHSLEWIYLNLNQILTSHQTTFSIMKTNNRKVGLNVLTTHFSILNGIIPLNWLTNSLDSFKVKCKKCRL